MRAVVFALFLVLVGLSSEAAGKNGWKTEHPLIWQRFAEIQLFQDSSQDRKMSIDPDASVYGVKFGSTENEVMAEFGQPQGIIFLNDTMRAFLYGQSHLFIFRKGKLGELMVNKHGLLRDLRRYMETHPFFDSGRWMIEPGLRFRMKFTEVRRMLNKPGAKPGLKYTFHGERSSTTLLFSRKLGRSDAEAYRLYGFSIVHRGQ